MISSEYMDAKWAKTGVFGGPSSMWTKLGFPGNYVKLS
jgi:hypothetical protein